MFTRDAQGVPQNGIAWNCNNPTYFADCEMC